MKVLCLLASLCLPSLILSDFKEMSMMCNHNETKICHDTDSCKWNVSLDTCLTLQIDCKERTNKSSSKTLCNSPVECGLENTGKFLEKLLGNISCHHTNGLTSCILFLSCNQTIYLCENKDCDLHYILSGNNYRECTFYHSITQCIKKSGKFQEDINCTMTPSVDRSFQHGSCGPTGGNLTAIGTTCPSADPYCVATIVLGCVTSLLVMLFLLIAYIWLKRCHNNQGERQHPDNAYNQVPQEDDH